jgi:hypothetical protein
LKPKIEVYENGSYTIDCIGGYVSLWAHTRDVPSRKDLLLMAQKICAICGKACAGEDKLSKVEVVEEAAS